MPYCSTTFQRLLEPLDRRFFKRIVDKHGGDHGVGSGPGGWSCERHFKTLLFAQITGLVSLREIEAALAAKPAALYHLGLRAPRRTTLSDASRSRPAAVFRDLASHCLTLTNRRLRREGREVIRILDASPLRLDSRPRGLAGASAFGWAQADPRVFGLKLHLAYDPRDQYPVHFDVTSPKASDLSFARRQPLQAGAMYVFDKGYADYNWWQEIVAADAFFVTRLKTNAHRRQRQIGTPCGAGILADNRMCIGHHHPRGGVTNALYDTPLREVIVARDGKAPLVLVTNDLTRSAEDISALYKERWQIELVFKWIKQNLNIKTFLGRSENAVRMQIYVALIAFMLLALFKQTFKPLTRLTGRALMARIGLTLLDALDLTGRSKPPPQNPKSRPPSPQYALPWTQTC